FGVSGTVTNACGNCSSLSGTIRSRAFPSPSFILGTSVVLEIETPNGTVVFRGTVDESGSKIVGRHQFVGGIHDGKSGSACFGRLGQAPGACFSRSVVLSSPRSTFSKSVDGSKSTKITSRGCLYGGIPLTRTAAVPTRPRTA